jgi:thioredoxin-like negative regulator of GroEL
MSPRVRLRLTLLVVATLGLTACFGGPPPPVNSALAAAAQKLDALALSDALEELIASGQATKADRQFAYDAIRAHVEDTAAYNFARAAVTGRIVQQKGLLAAGLVGDVERYARRSRELDPNFRDGAATRMLGTLYVLAPSALLRHGDSEAGLELLEGLVKSRPDILENHLRVAEAYLALGDPAPATPHLCKCIANKAKLRRDDQALLAKLLEDAGNLACPPQPQSRVDVAPRSIGLTSGAAHF